jgi:hypothetical protein
MINFALSNRFIRFESNKNWKGTGIIARSLFFGLKFIEKIVEERRP